MTSKRPNEDKKTLGDHIAVAGSAILQTFPFTGGLGRYLDEYYPSQQKRNIENFVTTLKAHAEEIDKVNCDLNILAALVNKICLQSLQTASERKRAAFRAILLNYASGKTSADHELELYVQLVDRLTELQIEMLNVALNRYGIAKKKGLLDPRNIAHTSIAFEQIVPSSNIHLSRIAYKELLHYGLFNTKVELPDDPGFPVDISFLILSEYGKRFLEWIKRE